MNKDEITNLRSSALAQIMDATSVEELEKIRANYIGRKGALSKLMSKIPDLDEQEKKEVGIHINQTKDTIIKEIALQSNKLTETKKTSIDPTIPGEKTELGSIHLITQGINKISRVFEDIGFGRARYPEVEWDYFAFGALNFSENHPARDEWETFLMDAKPNKTYGPMLLTPHTSSGQVREMLRHDVPIRMMNISKCYRRQSDISHTPMFHQFEGLVIDENISISNLKWTLDYFATEFFGKGRKTRLRPYNFPFTEPSFEIDITCDVCDGKGCKLCKEGWLELGGAGMVHPNVLKAGKINTKKYSGFAFGWGVERVIMMQTGIGIDDLRTLYSTDVRYLKQF